MSSATVCNCQHNTLDPEGLWAMSSRQSGQQQKTPDGHTCWAGSVVRTVGDLVCLDQQSCSTSSPVSSGVGYRLTCRSR